MIYFLLVCMIICLFLVYYIKIKKQNYDMRTPPAYPESLPLIGHAHLIPTDPCKLEQMLESFSDYAMGADGVITFYLGPINVYVITDPDDCMTISYSCLNKGFLYDFVKSWIGKGLLTIPGAEWKVKSKIINPAFNINKLKDLLAVFNEKCRTLTRRLEEKVGKGPCDVYHILGVNALEMVCLSAMSFDMDKEFEVAKSYLSNLEAMYGLLLNRFFSIWTQFDILFNWSSLKKQQDNLIESLRHVTNRMIIKRKEYFKTKTDDQRRNDNAETFRPIIDTLIETSIKEGTLNDEEIRDHIDTLIIAGHESSSTAVLCSLIEMAKQPDIQDKIRDELNEVFGNSDRDVDKEDLNKLTYLEAVIKEVLRKNPIVPFVTREVDKEIKLRKYTLKAGSLAILSLYGLGRHLMWGNDVQEFRPERFLDGSAPDYPGLFGPFGVGRRTCIGKTYALMSIKVVLAHILRNFRVSKARDEELVLKFKLVRKPISGHEIVLEKI